MAKATIPIYERLSEKTALTLYTNYLNYRYNFSRVVAESLYKDARYLDLLFDKEKRNDGQIIYYAVDRNEKAGKSLKDCQYRKIILTLRDSNDIQIRAKKGLIGLRRHKLKRISDEAVLQVAPLSQEDCANVLDVDRRTIIRDIAALRKQGVEIITRSHFTDQGRSISHKERIVKLFLRGFTITDVADQSKHDLANVQRYIYDFLRISLLYQEGKNALMIARVTKVSEKLAQDHISLYERLRQDASYSDALVRQMNFYASQLKLDIEKKRKEMI
jgi:biotin operon repressor